MTYKDITPQELDESLVAICKANPTLRNPRENGGMGDMDWRCVYAKQEGEDTKRCLIGFYLVEVVGLDYSPYWECSSAQPVMLDLGFHPATARRAAMWQAIADDFKNPTWGEVLEFVSTFGDVAA